LIDFLTIEPAAAQCLREGISEVSIVCEHVSDCGGDVYPLYWVRVDPNAVGKFYCLTHLCKHVLPQVSEGALKLQILGQDNVIRDFCVCELKHRTRGIEAERHNYVVQNIECTMFWIGHSQTWRKQWTTDYSEAKIYTDKRVAVAALLACKNEAHIITDWGTDRQVMECCNY